MCIGLVQYSLILAAAGGGRSPPSPPVGDDSRGRVSLGLLVDRLTIKRDHTRDTSVWDDDRTIGRLIELNRQLQRERVQGIIDAVLRHRRQPARRPRTL
jgi:hypothetical protein